MSHLHAESFHRGILLGLRTALVISRESGQDRTPGDIQTQIAEIKESMQRLYPGSARTMVEADIMLAMPLMAAGDLGCELRTSEAPHA